MIYRPHYKCIYKLYKDKDPNELTFLVIDQEETVSDTCAGQTIS